MSYKYVKAGVVRSRRDHRDYAAEDIFHTERLAGSPASYIGKKTLPDEHFLFDENSGSELLMGGNTVYNQGASYKCVSFVGCTIREKQVYNEGLDLDVLDNGKRKITFSKDFLYDMRSNSHSDGMSGADLMNILVNYGNVKESDYEEYLRLYNHIYELEKRKRLISQDPAKEAESATIDEIIHEEQGRMNSLIYRIKSNGPNDVYAHITTVNGLKESLFYNGACLIILPFYGNPESIKFWLPNSYDGSAGEGEMGHAVTVVGYSDAQQAFFLRNTWGPKWNGSGHVWFPYSNLKLAWETWTIFPNGTTHLTYYKNRMAAASISPSLLPSIKPHYAAAPLKECKCTLPTRPTKSHKPMDKSHKPMGKSIKPTGKSIKPTGRSSKPIDKLGKSSTKCSESTESSESDTRVWTTKKVSYSSSNDNDESSSKDNNKSSSKDNNDSNSDESKKVVKFKVKDSHTGHGNTKNKILVDLLKELLRNM